MANFLSPDRVAELRRSLDSGFGVRATSVALGIAKNTVMRYAKLEPPRRCACGQPLSHRGWCSVRLARSPSRQAFLARWKRPAGIVRPPTARVLLRYPYIAEGTVSVDRLMMEVNDAVPRHLPDHVRADVCQEMLAALLGQEIVASDIRGQVKNYLRRHYQSYSDRFRFASLDAVLPGTDNLRYLDTIASDREHF